MLLAVEAGNQQVVRELLSSKAKEQLKIVKGVRCVIVTLYNYVPLNDVEYMTSPKLCHIDDVTEVTSHR